MRLIPKFSMLALAATLALPLTAAAQKPVASAAERPLADEQLVVEATFPGPAEGTLIQRIRDRRTGTLCYLYVPAHLPINRDEGGALIHGANSIGSISCLAGPAPR
jgi:hypothetical protein